MKFFFTIFLIILFFPVLFFAQSPRIEGHIIDAETREPLSGVSVYLYVKGVPIKVTSNNGKFTFDGDVKADSYGSYTFSFYKPGYENKSELKHLPLRAPIELRKSDVGYIQLLEKGTNRFLEGIEIQHQGSPKPNTTNNHGYFEMDIPPGVSLDKEYRISIKGGIYFKDTVAVFKARDLKARAMPIYVSRKKLDYFELIEAYEYNLDMFHQGLIKNSKAEQNYYFNNCRNILNSINNLKDLSSEAIKDFRKRVPPVMNIHFEYIQNIYFNKRKKEDYEEEYKKANLKFGKAYNDYLKHPPTYREIPQKINELFSLSYISLSIAIERYKLHPPGKKLVEIEAEQILTLRDRFHKTAMEKIPNHVPDSEKIIEEIHRINKRYGNNLAAILESLKK